MVCTDPFPKERVPNTVPRRWSCSAPATISEALADPTIDQHDDRLTACQIAWGSVVALDVILGSATGGNNFAPVQESIGNANGLAEKAARVEAKVEDIPLEFVIGNLGTDFLDGIFDTRQRFFGKPVDVDIANVIALNSEFHRLQFDDCPYNLDFKRLVGPFPSGS